MPSFFSRFTGVGRLPERLRLQLEPEGIVHVAERVHVRHRFSGSVPGLHQGLSTSRHRGLVVFTRERLYALLPTAPSLTQPVIDQRWDAPQNGPVRAVISAGGVLVDIDVTRIDPRFSGELALDFAVDLADDVLAQLPTLRLSYPVSPEYVFHLLGVRAR